MSLIEEVKVKVDQGTRIVKEKIFGVNNERLEFLLDSFYKLDQNAKNAVLGVLAAGIGAFIIGAVSIYIVQVGEISKELTDTINANTQLRSLEAMEKKELDAFNNLVKEIERKNRNIGFKPFFEKLARKANIPIKSIAERQPEMDAQNPLAQYIQQVNIDLKLLKISLPKLINFVDSIEKSGHFLKVQDLKISGIFGDKLYFDVDLLVRGYKTTR